MNYDITKRFKECYEIPQRFFLQKRMPVIIRIDGKCFHSASKVGEWEQPYDRYIAGKMAKAGKAASEELHAVFGYIQSDEISLLLLNDKNYETEPIFDNEVNKLVSIAASAATFGFVNNDCFHRIMFDARAFNISQDEIINYFISRQLDCVRNAKNGWAQYTLAKKMGKKTARQELLGLGASKQIEKVEFETGENFNDMPETFIYGQAMAKSEFYPGISQAPLYFIENKDFIQTVIDDYYEKVHCL